MSRTYDRAYAMVAETRPLDDPAFPIPFTWRASQDVLDALIAEGRPWLDGVEVMADLGIDLEARLFGYPFRVDESLPPDTLLLEAPRFVMTG